MTKAEDAPKNRGRRKRGQTSNDLSASDGPLAATGLTIYQPPNAISTPHLPAGHTLSLFEDSHTTSLENGQVSTLAPVATIGSVLGLPGQIDG
jgi:hypothetical protein